MPPRMIGPRLATGKFYKKRPVGSKKAKLSPEVKNAVTAIVKGAQETKYAFSALNTTSFNSAIATTADWYNCLPDVQTGLLPYERVGVRIQPTTLKMSWCIGFNPEVDRTCDNYVVLYVFKMRKFKTFDEMAANGDPNLFLDQAVGGLTAFSGYTQQLITPINKEQYILVHKKVVHLQKGVGLLNNANAFPWASGAGKTAHTISISMKLPKLIYDEDTSVTPQQPNNFGLAWAIGYAHTDQAVPDQIYQDIQVTQTSQLYYKDA